MLRFAIKNILGRNHNTALRCRVAKSTSHSRLSDVIYCIGNFHDVLCGVVDFCDATPQRRFVAESSPMCLNLWSVDGNNNPPVLRIVWWTRWMSPNPTWPVPLDLFKGTGIRQKQPHKKVKFFFLGFWNLHLILLRPVWGRGYIRLLLTETTPNTFMCWSPENLFRRYCDLSRSITPGPFNGAGRK